MNNTYIFFYSTIYGMNITYLTINALVLTAVLSIVLTSSTMYYAFAYEEPNVDVDAEIEQDQDCDSKEGSSTSCASAASIDVNVGSSPS